MNKILRCKVRERTNNGSTYYEGTVELPGALTTKLAKTRDNDTRYTSRASLTQAAKSFAQRYGFTGGVTFVGSDNTALVEAF